MEQSVFYVMGVPCPQKGSQIARSQHRKRTLFHNSEKSLWHTRATSILEPRRIRKCQALLFLPGRNGEDLCPIPNNKSAQDFLSKMDLGLFDRPHGLSVELGKLTLEQLEEIGTILLHRSSRAEKFKPTRHI